MTAVSDSNQPVFSYTRACARGKWAEEMRGKYRLVHADSSIPAGRMRGRGGTGRFKQYNSAHDKYFYVYMVYIMLY